MLTTHQETIIQLRHDLSTADATIDNLHKELDDHNYFNPLPTEYRVAYARVEVPIQRGVVAIRLSETAEEVMGQRFSRMLKDRFTHEIMGLLTPLPYKRITPEEQDRYHFNMENPLNFGEVEYRSEFYFGCVSRELAYPSGVINFKI